MSFEELGHSDPLAETMDERLGQAELRLGDTKVYSHVDPFKLTLCRYPGTHPLRQSRRCQGAPKQPLPLSINIKYRYTCEQTGARLQIHSLRLSRPCAPSPQPSNIGFY
jgi:hypothetical protein